LFQAHFKVVKKIKPKASRPQSAETFLVGIGLKPQAQASMPSEGAKARP
jgi:23S rRNA (uridine2552-2'-O)-methyltransferase